MADLASMRNIGKEIERKLKSVGINSAEELSELGGKEAFSRLKMQYPNVCLVTLYAIQGAVDDVEYNQLSDEVKRDLKSFCDGLNNELLKNLDKLHTTELGAERIKGNLSLDVDNVVEWCKIKISLPHALITRKGKNWYVNVDGCILTVNAYSYTIITAHREKMGQ